MVVDRVDRVDMVNKGEYRISNVEGKKTG